MIFFFKKRPIVLTCVTNYPGLLQFAPVQRASKFLPDWWKRLPESFVNEGDITIQSTMKSCKGFVDLYSKGVILPIWCDLALEIGRIGTNGYRYQFADRKSSIDCHDPKQHGRQFHECEYQHLKINSPWRFMCDESINFSFLEPTWNVLPFQTLRIVPGIVDFQYQTGTNINCFISRTERDQSFVIPFLTPLAHIVPLSDRPIKLKLSDDVELFNSKKVFDFIPTFTNKYKTMKKFFTGKNNGS